ncbi:MAG: deoxyribose-phosphate aldolase [Anaerolineales bacterium]|nr:deoxyribose-phosphate aldolase [Anaerolineales bacterium]
MPADRQTVERLVEVVTRQVLLALAEDERRATGLGVECSEECGAGHCIRHCGSKIELIVQAGADRLSAGLGASPARPELAGMIDHTLLKPDATADQIAQLCYEARKHGFAAVCVNPTYVALAAQLLRGSPVAVCTVVGFPLGATPPEVKAYEAQVALDQGATEIDMVINIGALKSRDYEMVARDIRAVVRVTHAHAAGALVKVIIEAALLTDEEKVAACLLSKESGADYVKTSTGFASGGATVADVALMRRAVGPSMGVKAAGGIRTREDADALVQAGATRIGASAGIKIVQTPAAGSAPAAAATAPAITPARGGSY